MRVRIPTPLRSYTGQQAAVEMDGTTVAEVLAGLDAAYPGIRFRLIDEQQRLRPHMKILVNETSVDDLATALSPTDEVTIMQALSGG